MPAVRAHNFAQSDLSGSSGGEGDGQVHEIHAADEQNQKGDGGVDIDIIPIAGRFHFSPKPGIHMDLGEGLEEELKQIHFPVEPVLIFLIDDGGDPLNLFLEIRGLGRGRQFHVRVFLVKFEPVLFE